MGDNSRNEDCSFKISLTRIDRRGRIIREGWDWVGALGFAERSWVMRDFGEPSHADASSVRHESFGPLYDQMLPWE